MSLTCGYRATFGRWDTEMCADCEAGERRLIDADLRAAQTPEAM